MGLIAVKLIIPCCLLIFWPAMSAAQSQGGAITGTIVDRSGGGVPAAAVEVAGPGPRPTFITSTDGQFRFPHLPPGVYDLSASKPGFQPAKRTGLVVRVGETLAVSLMLEVEILRQSVDVAPSRTSANSILSMTQDEVVRIPMSGHVAALLPSVPGVVLATGNVPGQESHQQPQFVFRGSRMLDAAWAIDGVVVTDRQTGSTPGYYDLEAFAEIQYASASSDIARPGSGLGVSMVVRSGTNQLHGTARGSYTGEALQSRDLRDDLRGAPHFVTPDTADHTDQLSDFGAYVGGPLRRGRAWWFASAGRQDVRVFRLAGGPERTLLTPRTVKVNWQATSRDALNVLWLDHGVERFGVNPAAFRAAPTARQDHKMLYSEGPFRGLWKVEDHRMAGPSLFLAARYAYYNTGMQNTSVGSGPAGISARLGETLGATSSSWSVRPQHSLGVDVTHYRKLRRTSHEIRLGAGWQQLDMRSRSLWPGDGIVGFDNSSVDRRARIYREQASQNRLTFLGVYVNDTWTIGHLTVDLGLRFDQQSGRALSSRASANPAFPQILPALTFSGQKARVWRDLSPRATVRYAMDAHGRTVLRGTFGRYVPQLVMGVAAQTNPTHVSAWIEYPWEDLNGDRLAQPEEVRTDLPYLAFEGIDPRDPSAGSAAVLDPRLPSRVTTGASVALQREVSRHLRAEVSYHYARDTNWPHNRWHGVGPDDYFLQSLLTAVLPDGTVINVPLYSPNAQRVIENGSTRVIAADDGYYSTYHGLEGIMTRRWSNGWMLGATAALNNPRSFYGRTPPSNSSGNPTRLDGTTGGGPISGPRDPLVHGGQLAPAATARSGGGMVLLNSRWQVGVHGARALPWGFQVAANLVGRQGTPSPYVIPQRLGLDGSRNILVSPRIDSVRLENIWNLDLRLSKRVEYRKGTLQVLADVFNGLNSHAALVRERNLRSPNFDRVNMTVSPRILRLGLRLSY